jgi:hypothetical protein
MSGQELISCPKLYPTYAVHLYLPLDSSVRPSSIPRYRSLLVGILDTVCPNIEVTAVDEKIHRIAISASWGIESPYTTVSGSWCRRDGHLENGATAHEKCRGQHLQVVRTVICQT